MVVTGENGQTSPLFKIPQSERLIITRTQNPTKVIRIGVELYGTDVVEVTEEGEEAAAEFVVPYFDFVVVSSGHDEGFV